MNKKPFIYALMVVALMGMLLPASADYKSYIFKEDFDGTTLDNTTWVNTSDPFPYEMRDGNIVIHFDPDPLDKYAFSKPVNVGDTVHVEFDFNIYTSRFQENSSFANINLGVMFLKKTDNLTELEMKEHSVYSRIEVSNSVFLGGRFYYFLYVGRHSVSKSESYNFMAYSFGREIPMKVVFDIERNGSKYVVYQKIYKEGTLFVANMDYLFEKNTTMIFTIDVSKVDTVRPIDGYVSIDSIYAGDYYIPTEEKTIEAYRYFITTGMIMLAIASLFLFFHDRSELVDTIGVVAFYLSMILFLMFFLTYPEPIFYIPSWLYGLFPIAIMLLFGKEGGLFKG